MTATIPMAPNGPASVRLHEIALMAAKVSMWSPVIPIAAFFAFPPGAGDLLLKPVFLCLLLVALVPYLSAGLLSPLLIVQAIGNSQGRSSATFAKALFGLIGIAGFFSLMAHMTYPDTSLPWNADDSWARWAWKSAMDMMIQGVVVLPLLGPVAGLTLKGLAGQPRMFHWPLLVGLVLVSHFLAPLLSGELVN